ncbi:hypothetical protein ACNKU7_16475 [Microbulbifer sp. SA54]|uniref:hypothetical protein n=1 Tax=Microbulbifer sp. SA54 TaxID=3401577 RepID=UPI003AB040FE
MMILGEKREEELRKINFTPAIVRLMNGKFVHDDLEFRFQALRYSLAGDSMAPKDIGFIPMWEDDLSITGLYLVENRPVFIKFYVEDMEPIEIGRSVTDLIEFIVKEYGENESELRSILSAPCASTT